MHVVTPSGTCAGPLEASGFRGRQTHTKRPLLLLSIQRVRIQNPFTWVLKVLVENLPDANRKLLYWVFSLDHGFVGMGEG